MARIDEQYRTWLEFLGDVLQVPLGVGPVHEGQLMDLLNQSFDAACSTRNFVAPPWDNHVLTCWPRDYIPKEPPRDYDFRQQPLLRWYVLTGQTRPQSLGRVPDAVASKNFKQSWDEMAKPWNVNHQLSIPLQIGSDRHHTYLVQRPDRDFTEQEMELASLLQPILSGLALHQGLATSINASTSNPIPSLTLREMAILTLLGEGLTAEGIARRLTMSPRTAEKHLEHIYRKLDVRDRLMAVQRAHEVGILHRGRAYSPQV